MSLCLWQRDGEILVPRTMPAGAAPLLNAIAPYCEDVVVCVACLFTWYWLADLCARDGRPFVLGHALSMKALQGGKATNDPIDAQQSAVLLRGGMLPQAAVSPAELRATRAWLRRRVPLTRKRAELPAHLQNATGAHAPRGQPAPRALPGWSGSCPTAKRVVSRHDLRPRCWWMQ